DWTHGSAESCVAVHDVEPAEFLHGARDRRLDRGFLGYIGVLEDRIAAVLLAVAHHGLTAFAIEVGDYHRRTLAGEPDRGGAADSARGAGDYCYFLFKSAHGF